jgi:hypothetical protein
LKLRLVLLPSAVPELALIAKYKHMPESAMSDIDIELNVIIPP